MIILSGTKLGFGNPRDHPENKSACLNPKKKSRRGNFRTFVFRKLGGTKIPAKKSWCKCRKVIFLIIKK
ncbi:MAG: hypothetical protein B6245_00595 [Desulfobacteraceae bacterium 4572_88]|nr:MAG: hypothetical protein B6245_00595 [Desulfobacteraceae bacterium 4572_88]